MLGHQSKSVDLDIPDFANYRAKFDVAMQAIYHAMGVGVVVVGRLAVPAVPVATAVLAAVVGLVVLVAQLAEHFQQECWAALALAHPHQTILHLPEVCCPHLGTHAQYEIGRAHV